MENKAKFVPKIENITVFITGVFLLIFPLFILSVTTDAFVIPKQIALAVVVIAGFVLLGLKSIFNEGVKLRRTPFDLPLVLFVGAAFLSAILAVNQSSALIAFVPFMLAILLYFVVTNNVKRPQDFLFLTGSLIIGAVGVSIITLLSYFKIYILPFEFAKFQTFTPFGSLFDQSIYLALVFILCLVMAFPSIKRRAVDKSKAIYLVGAFFVLLGLVVSIIATVTIEKPQVLSMQTGFQTAFATISQDQGRPIPALLSGSGIGTYFTDFTRFKPATFNNNADQWSLTFLRSSSFFLETLATMGLLGILAFIFLAYRIIRTKPLFLPLIIALVFALIFPFSYTLIVLFFVILAIFSAQQGLNERNKTRFFDVELKLLSLRKGVLALDNPSSRRESEFGNLLPWIFFIVTVLFSLGLGYGVFMYSYSDYLFQKSLVAASQNDVQKTYDLQVAAIDKFDRRDDFRRVFSQINLNLANNFAASIPQGASPSAEQQQTIYQLIQTSINNGRAATTIAPQNSINWQNLAAIYRSLIGFGQDADQFALLSSQQALILDPNNPQQYINYGGIFYQLGQWDNAIRQFQIAANLKPDFANAYYNLGHALEQKGDLQNALIQYQRVRSLVSKDPQSLKAINDEIAALETKIGKASTGNDAAIAEESDEEQPPLGIQTTKSNLPEQNPPVKIQAPKTTVSPSPEPSTSPSPTPNR